MLEKMSAEDSAAIKKANDEKGIWEKKYRTDYQFVCSKGHKALLYEGEITIDCPQCSMDDFWNSLDDDKIFKIGF